jgi:outer membrane lipopolysaccharide assembly protein LptE/RlpB
MKHISRAVAAALAACSILLMIACGYQVAGTAARLPPDIKTIAIPVFANKSTRFRIEQKVSAAVTRQFIQQTSYRVTPDPAGADAELKGTINSVRSGVLTFDPNTGRATTFQIQVTASVELIDLHSKKVVFSNPNYTFREEYQVSQSAPALYEESEPALDRLSRDFARTLVTDIVENF